MLDKVGLKGKEHYFPGMLSGGQLQRCAIARALINNPNLIIADEPTGNLDADTAREIIQIFKNLNKNEGITFLIVTHDKSIIELADNVLELKNGRIISNFNKNKFTQDTV
jgi:ABC-type lipoprotein export system ATPase subunit